MLRHPTRSVSAFTPLISQSLADRQTSDSTPLAYLMIGAAAMYSFVSKVFSLLIDPAAIVFVLLVWALIIRKRRPKVFHTLLISAVVLLFVLSCPMTSVWLLKSLEKQYPDESIDARTPAQAIVVLGGSLRMPSGSHPASGITNSSDRLLVALRLYRAGKAPLVVASGGDSPLLLKVRSLHEAEVMKALLQEWGLPGSAILVEDQSVNTHENAVFTRRLVAPKGIQHIILVTSAAHMPRAAATFRKSGFDVEAVPADYMTGWDQESSLFDWVPASSALADSEFAIHEWIGIWAYRLHGWA